MHRISRWTYLKKKKFHFFSRLSRDICTRFRVNEYLFVLLLHLVYDKMEQKSINQIDGDEGDDINHFKYQFVIASNLV